MSILDTILAVIVKILAILFFGGLAVLIVVGVIALIAYLWNEVF